MATLQKSRRPVRRSATKAVAKKAAAKKGASKRPIRRAASKPRTNGSGRSHAVATRRKPETLRLRTLTPTFTVNDLEKSVAWYSDGLGFVVSERWEDGGKLLGVILKAGSCTINLSQDDFAKGYDREKGIGFRIYADTAQRVDALAERIRAYGGKITTEPTDTEWGTRSFTVEDPDGFKISFSQPR